MLEDCLVTSMHSNKQLLDQCSRGAKEVMVDIRYNRMCSRRTKLVMGWRMDKVVGRRERLTTRNTLTSTSHNDHSVLIN